MKEVVQGLKVVGHTALLVFLAILSCFKGLKDVCSSCSIVDFKSQRDSTSAYASVCNIKV